MNNSKDQFYANVAFEYIKLDESIEFFCDRCSKRKIAKSMRSTWIMAKARKSAMPCYGNVLSKRES